MENRTLKEAKLYQDENGLWYMSAVYLIEDDYRKSELRIPKIRMRIESGKVESLFAGSSQVRTSFVTPDGKFDLCSVEEDNSTGGYKWEQVVVEEKIIPMTVTEIERELGYKIKIVDEQGDSQDGTA